MAAIANKFTVEFGDDHGRNFRFGSLKQTLRGRWSNSEIAGRPGGGPQIGTKLTGLPDIPGLHLDVDCKASTYRLWDPLEQPGNEGLKQNILAVIKNASVFSADRLDGHAEQSGKLTPDQLVTMVCELKQMHDGGKVTLKKGDFPSDAALEEHEGRRLNDLWNSSAQKPRYADEQEAYAKELDQRTQ